MKKAMLIGCLLFCNASIAEEVTYTLKSEHLNNNYKIEVSYDTESSSITNSPIAGWQQVLSIPEAQIKVKYGEQEYSSTGALISASNNPWGSTIKIEAIQDPFGNINQVEFQIDANSDTPTMSPLDTHTGQNIEIYGGTFKMYLNDIGVYTSPYENIDSSLTEFSKTLPSQNNTCDKVVQVKNNLALICNDMNYCSIETEQKINEAVNGLGQACQ